MENIFLKYLPLDSGPHGPSLGPHHPSYSLAWLLGQTPEVPHCSDTALTSWQTGEWPACQLDCLQLLDSAPPKPPTLSSSSQAALPHISRRLHRPRYSSQQLREQPQQLYRGQASPSTPEDLGFTGGQAVSRDPRRLQLNQVKEPKAPKTTKRQSYWTLIACHQNPWALRPEDQRGNQN